MCSSDLAAQRGKNARKAMAHGDGGRERLQRREEQAAQEASAKQKDKVKGMRTVHRYEIEDHRAALHWIARNHRDAVTAFVEAFVGSNHKAMDIDGVKQWTEKEAF